MIWTTATQISSAFALLAFVAAAALTAYRSSLNSRVAQLKALPANDRGDALNKTLNSFGINAASMSPEQQFLLAMKELESRAKQTKNYVIAATVITLAAMVTAWALAGPMIEPKDKVYFKFRGVSLTHINEFPPKPPIAKIRITAFVNGRSLVYPSTAGVEFLQVGAPMPTRQYEIPYSNTFEIRFEGESDHGALASQQNLNVDYNGGGTVNYDYSLYPVSGGTHGAKSIVKVQFEISDQPN